MTDGQPSMQATHRRRRGVAILGVVLVAAAILVLGVLFVRSISGRLASARKLDSATAIAKQLDTDVVAIDLAVRSPIDEGSRETKALATKRIPRTRAQLEKVVTLTSEAYRALNDEERKQAMLLRDTAEARLAMLSVSEPILAADARAMAASDLLSSGWDHLVSGKGLSRDAAAQYNKLTKPSVTRSNRLLGQAASQLASADADFKAASDAFPSLDMQPYLTYVATLRQLNTLAIQSNTAWLKGQTAQANVLTTRYNILEKQALEEAAALPQSPNKAIADAYEQATSSDLQKYITARKKATEADKRLRQM